MSLILASKGKGKWLLFGTTLWGFFKTSVLRSESPQDKNTHHPNSNKTLVCVQYSISCA